MLQLFRRFCTIQAELPSVIEKTSKFLSIYHPRPDYPHLVTNDDFNIKNFKGKRESKRCGLLATKVGMTHEWDEWGTRHPLTVLQVDRCQVVQIKTMDKEGYNAIQLGAGERSLRKATKPLIGHFIKADVPPKKKLVECRVTPDCFLPLGYELSARHFIVGQKVDIQGITTGKGFQGAVKRYGFSMQPASHGNSKAHRRLGSIGGGQDPGRVWPGKKMPGRMGGKNRTVEGLIVYKIDADRQLIYIRGAVPGKPGNIVRVQDCWREKNNATTHRQTPHPTWLPKEGAEEPDVMVMPAPELDPFETKMFYHENVLNLRPYIEEPEEMIPPVEDRTAAAVAGND